MKSSIYYNNRGQKDRSEKRSYTPPRGLLESALTWTKRGMKNNADANRSYKAGYFSKDQKKR